MDFLDELDGRLITDHANALTLVGTRTICDVSPCCRDLGEKFRTTGPNRNARHAMPLSLKTSLKSQTNSSFCLSFPSSYRGQKIVTDVQ